MWELFVGCWLNIHKLDGQSQNLILATLTNADKKCGLFNKINQVEEEQMRKDLKSVIHDMFSSFL